MALSLAGCWLWGVHAIAWGLGGRSPVLNYDTAQYALAARELASHGRLATTFALPLELSHHAAPPWPLAVVQPGLVLVEGAIFKIVPPSLSIGGRQLYQMWRPDQREWLAIVAPLLCYLLIGTALARIVMRLLSRHAPGRPRREVAAAGVIVALAFLLDPEAQHFAVSGFTELPFTLGLLAALAALALDAAPARPLAFGVLLGATGAFRANMLWLAPVLCAAAAVMAPPPRRVRVALVSLAGYVVLTAPWWIYKWHAFGSPAWDLTRFVVWDGIGGRTWTSIYHEPALPSLPAGAAAVQLLALKVMRNLPPLLLASLTGPRALWLGALVAWLAFVRGPRPLFVAGLVTLVLFALGLLAAAASIPWLRYVFPARVLLEAAGLLAMWGLAARVPASPAAPSLARLLAGGTAVLAIGWGTLATARANVEARATVADRNLPGVATLLATGVIMNREIPAGEAVMSNLGPALAWHARRPVVHLALSPADLDACRRLLDIRNVILVFRDPERAGPEWGPIVARPQEATHDPEWNIRRARMWKSADGFSIVWLELGPLRPRLACAGGRGSRGRRDEDRGDQRGGVRASPGMMSVSEPCARPPFSSPSSTAGYSAGRSRRLSTNTGTSSASAPSASGPGATRTIS